MTGKPSLLKCAAAHSPGDENPKFDRRAAFGRHTLTSLPPTVAAHSKSTNRPKLEKRKGWEESNLGDRCLEAVNRGWDMVRGAEYAGGSDLGRLVRRRTWQAVQLPIFGTNTPMQWPSWASHFLSLDIFSSGAEYISIKWISNQHGDGGIESPIPMRFINIEEQTTPASIFHHHSLNHQWGRIRISNCDRSPLKWFFMGSKWLVTSADKVVNFMYFWFLFGSSNSCWQNAGDPVYNFALIMWFNFTGDNVRI